MDQNENVTDYSGGNGESTSILIGIVVAIILGILIGGYAPEFAKNFDVLGKIFLNSLKMIVVPLVVLSMIVGITGLGDIRNIGTIGGRTVLYYMVTTAVSVIIGIIMVNIVRPGVGISTGEEHIEYSYTLDGRTVNIGNESQKSGLPPDKVNNFLSICTKELDLEIIGLMCLPPYNEDSSKYFKEMKKLISNTQLSQLSMGMSNDYLEAIDYNSSFVRIGTKIFGERN